MTQNADQRAVHNAETSSQTQESGAGAVEKPVFLLLVKISVGTKSAVRLTINP